MGPTQCPIQWVPGALPLGVKRPGHETDHSPPSRADVKNAWSYTSTYPIRFHGVVLISEKKHRDSFTFTSATIIVFVLCLCRPLIYTYLGLHQNV
jgi:hypothetical protein